MATSLLLLIDNFDSFVHNLARYFERLGQQTLVVRNDATSVAEIKRLRPQAIAISPGPCRPREAGCSLDVVKHFTGEIPLLGVCLGHQAIGEALGGQVVRASRPMHGRTSTIEHRGDAIFAGLPRRLNVCRYHSLVVERESLPASLEVTAETADGTIMAMRHREHPVFGVQFHPEAILTEGGYQMLANFLDLAGVKRTAHIPQVGEEKPIDYPAQNDIPFYGSTAVTVR